MFISSIGAVHKVRIRHARGGSEKVWQFMTGEVVKSMWRHTYKKICHTYKTWNFGWCLTFSCNSILTEGWTDKLNHPGQNLPDKRPSDKTPGQKPARTIEREFVQGAFVRVFCTRHRPTKNRGVPRCVTYFRGVPGCVTKCDRGRGG